MELRVHLLMWLVAVRLLLGGGSITSGGCVQSRRLQASAVMAQGSVRDCAQTGRQPVHLHALYAVTALCEESGDRSVSVCACSAAL